MWLRDKVILAVDDTASIRTFLKLSMQAMGAAVHEAGNAAEGIEQARAVSPELVVLDLGLPDKDGLEVLPELKALHKPPVVIILSVRKEQATKEKAFRLGAEAYLTKPFLMEDLLEVIKAQLQRSSVSA